MAAKRRPVGHRHRSSPDWARLSVVRVRSVVVVLCSDSVLVVAPGAVRVFWGLLPLPALHDSFGLAATCELVIWLVSIVVDGRVARSWRRARFFPPFTTFARDENCSGSVDHNGRSDGGRRETSVSLSIFRHKKRCRALGKRLKPGVIAVVQS